MFLKRYDERVNLEYAGRNSQDAMTIIKEGNSAFYQNPCKAQSPPFALEQNPQITQG